jgi:putative transposase
VIDDWALYLADDDSIDRRIIAVHTSTGRPLGNAAFVARIEHMTGRVLKKKKPGPKPKKA